MQNKIEILCLKCPQKLLEVDFGEKPIIQERLIVVKCDGCNTLYKVSIKIEKESTSEDSALVIPKAKMEIDPIKQEKMCE